MSAAIASAVERDFSATRTLQQLDGEPILPTLLEYLRELIHLLKRPDVDEDFAAKLGRLVELHEHLSATSPRTSGGAA